MIIQAAPISFKIEKFDGGWDVTNVYSGSRLNIFKSSDEIKTGLITLMYFLHPHGPVGRASELSEEIDRCVAVDDGDFMFVEI
jgi:hypothetical protein